MIEDWLRPRRICPRDPESRASKAEPQALEVGVNKTDKNAQAQQVITDCPAGVVDAA